jgi:hypothetical protein
MLRFIRDASPGRVPGRPRRLRVEWRPRWGRRRRRRWWWDAVRRWRWRGCCRVHGGRSRVPGASTDRRQPVLGPGHVRLWSEPLLRRGIRVHWRQVGARRRWVCLHRRPDRCFGHDARGHERRWLGRRRSSIPDLLRDGHGLRSVPAKELRRALSVHQGRYVDDLAIESYRQRHGCLDRCPSAVLPLPTR